MGINNEIHILIIDDEQPTLDALSFRISDDLPLATVTTILFEKVSSIPPLSKQTTHVICDGVFGWKNVLREVKKQLPDLDHFLLLSGSDLKDQAKKTGVSFLSRGEKSEKVLNWIQQSSTE
jgi:hypothetical protein